MCYTAESVTGGVTTEADTSRIFDVSGDVADDHVPQLDDRLDSSITAPEANLVTVSEPAPLPKTPVKAVAFAEPRCGRFYGCWAFGFRASGSPGFETSTPLTPFLGVQDSRRRGGLRPSRRRRRRGRTS